MKYLKMTVAVFAFAVFAVSTVHAQADPAMTVQEAAVERGAKKSPEERAQMQTDKMAKMLDLTADQKAKIQAINLQFAQEGAVKGAERRAARKDKDAQIAAVLTDDQKAQLKERRKSNVKNRKERKHARKAIEEKKSDD